MKLLDLLSIFSILPPGGMVLFNWNRLDLADKILGALILFTFLMEVLGTTLFQLGINNLFLFNLFTWVEATLLVVYFRSLSQRKGYKILFFCWGIVFILFSVFSLVYGEKIDHYNSLQRSIGSIWAVVLCMFFLMKIFQESVIKNLFRYSPFLMTSTFLLYFAGTLFHNLFADYLMTNKIDSFNTFNIHSVLNIFLNIIYTIVIWMGSRRAILRRS